MLPHYRFLFFLFLAAAVSQAALDNVLIFSRCDLYEHTDSKNNLIAYVNELANEFGFNVVANDNAAQVLNDQALEQFDLVCVHVEATDEASHEGDAAAKVRALQEIDRQIVAPLHEALKSRGNYRILVTPDHPTPLRTKTHSHGFVPWAIAGSGVRPDAATTYDDPTAGRSELAFAEGWKLMKYFLR